MGVTFSVLFMYFALISLMDSVCAPPLNSQGYYHTHKKTQSKQTRFFNFHPFNNVAEPIVTDPIVARYLLVKSTNNFFCYIHS
jgi:hypothetical protein